MDTRDLMVFAAVYEASSISRAAKELYLSPQGCSKIIHKLESELDTALFARSPYGVKATPQGDALYQQAHQVIEILEGIKGDIAQVSSWKYTLNVASTQGMTEYLTMDFIRDFRETFPSISPRIMESPDTTAKHRLTHNEAELGILGGPIDLTTYHAIPFTSHAPCLMINKLHPLAKKKTIEYEDLHNQSLAMVSREFASYHLVTNRLKNEGVELDIVMEATELEYCHRLAQGNEVIAVTFDFAAWASSHDETVILPFADHEFRWETFLVHRRDAVLSSQAEHFCEFAVSWLESHRELLFQWPSRKCVPA